MTFRREQTWNCSTTKTVRRESLTNTTWSCFRKQILWKSVQEQGFLTTNNHKPLPFICWVVHFPDYVVTHDPESTVGYYPLETAVNARILVLRYLVEGHAAPSTGKYLTYRETPWGTVYLKQFQGRCLMRLAYGFGNKQEAFRSAMEKIGATPLEHGDIAYEFEVIDGFRVQMILWAGDDEFPPSSQILFSDNFPIAFQAEDMAVVGDVSITMIKALA